MSEKIVNRKNQLAQAFFSWLNKVVLGVHFKGLEFAGLENIPASGPFLVIANHQSRWDGLLVMKAINRVANYMVSPNELRGFQGNVIKSMGGFPADRRFNLLPYIEERVRKGEPIVIFPEGNVFRDGVIHPFKDGAARVALMCHEIGVVLPIVSMAIAYGYRTAKVSVSRAVPVVDELNLGNIKDRNLIRQLSVWLQEKMIVDVEALKKSSSPVAFDSLRRSEDNDRLTEREIA